MQLTLSTVKCILCGVGCTVVFCGRDKFGKKGTTLPLFHNNSIHILKSFLACLINRLKVLRAFSTFIVYFALYFWMRSLECKR